MAFDRLFHFCFHGTQFVCADVMAQYNYSWSETALNFWATMTLVVMAVTSLLLRYVMDPVTCFTPAHFEAAHNAYARQICYQTQHILSSMSPVSSMCLAVHGHLCRPKPSKLI